MHSDEEESFRPISPIRGEDGGEAYRVRLESYYRYVLLEIAVKDRDTRNYSTVLE